MSFFQSSQEFDYPFVSKCSFKTSKKLENVAILLTTSSHYKLMADCVHGHRRTGRGSGERELQPPQLRKFSGKPLMIRATALYFWNYNNFIRRQNCELVCFYCNLSAFVSHFSTHAFRHCVIFFRARRSPPLQVRGCPYAYGHGSKFFSVS